MNIIKLFLSGCLVFISASAFSQHGMKDMPGMKMPVRPTGGEKPKDAKKKNEETQIYYTCVMHSQVKKDKPGNCPICGMTLVKKTIKVSPQKSAPKKHDMQIQKDTMPMHHKDTDQMQENKNPNDTSMHNNMHDMDMKANTSPVKEEMHMNYGDTMKVPMGGGHERMNMGNMSDPFSLHLPMERHGSGTGWLPDASPMNAYMFHTAKWMYMLHGNRFLRYTNQDFTNKGIRGNEKFDAPNWVMFMGQRRVGINNLFHFSAMVSLDPVTEGGAGYPLLFQSGEAYKGKAIVDRQHPHDLFSELSVSYSHAFSKNTDAFIYLGYPGEPALGPVAFMHRPSALDNPDAPLSHHWSDATHITFGVATLGFRFNQFKLDGSLFTGREPDDNRYDFDKPKFDSWSGRLSYNPTANWALQVSHGFIKSPELLHPDEDVNRTTASAIYSQPLKNNDGVNISAVYGLNKSKGHNGENSFLLEGALNIKKFAFYSRYEYVQKSVEELALDENLYGTDAVFPVNTFTLGLNYNLTQVAKTRLSLGTQFTYYHAPDKLNSLYGKGPMGLEVYLRIYPSSMKM